MTLWQRFSRWRLEQRIASAERRIIDQQRERSMVDDIIDYHRNEIARLELRKAQRYGQAHR